MGEINTRAKYVELFSGDISAKTRQQEALRQALDIRKFEIDLYWKRATYFWTFIGASFAGFVAMESVASAFQVTYVLVCLGAVFSTGWYFVNRGSKCWQRNWERHVDLLEDEVMGPLYKTTADRYSYRFWNLADAYPFSVSKINQILNLFIIGVWSVLIVRTLALAPALSPSDKVIAVVMSATAAAALIALFLWGRTSPSDHEIQPQLRTRSYR